MVMNTLRESTSLDIQSLPQKLSKLIQERYQNSLLWQICDNFELKSTLGKIFVTKKVNDSLTLISKDIEPHLHKIETSITQEALQDILSMYGAKGEDLLVDMLGGIMNQAENEQLMEFIDNNAQQKPDLRLGEVADYIVKILDRIGQSVIEMNQFTFETEKAWAIIPKAYAGVFFGYWAGFRMTEEKENQILYLGKFGHLDLYVDPRKPVLNHSEFSDAYDDAYALGTYENYDYVYVGLKNKKLPGYGSLVYAPYQLQLQEVLDPNTGHHKFFLFNRYGLETSPFHNIPENRAMIHKFKITRG